MASHGDSKDLATIVQHYEEVADLVNQREMKRFIEEVRQRWAPEPEDLYENRLYEGYTDAGAFARCVYGLAFTDWYPPQEQPDEDLCEAERQNQILLHLPIDEMVEWIEKPLITPQPPNKVREHLKRLRMNLQQQADTLGLRTDYQVELPLDFEALMTITDGLGSAGEPSETVNLQLVYSLESQRAERTILKHLTSPGNEVPLAAWNVGCSFRAGHREIYYVLYDQPSNNDDATPR